MTRIACFDLGVIGALVEAKIDKGVAFYKDHTLWRLDKGTKADPGLNIDEPDRYFWFMGQVGPVVSRSDVVLYELVQFNRGRSSIPGFRAILLAACGTYRVPCIGVNVATLKSFAGLKKVPKGQSKAYMRVAMVTDYPDFARKLMGGKKLDDNLVDAGMLCHYAAAKLEIGK